MVLAKLLRSRPRLPRRAYGQDIAAQTIDRGQKNIEDTAEPWDNDETVHNAVNQSSDARAEEEFPGLGERVERYPSRRR